MDYELRPQVTPFQNQAISIEIREHLSFQLSLLKLVRQGEAVAPAEACRLSEIESLLVKS